jgi:nicotinamidase-related amidase
MTVVEDATATLWPEIQRATLDIVRRAYARVVTTKQLAEEIGRWSPSKAGL